MLSYRAASLIRVTSAATAATGRVRCASSLAQARQNWNGRLVVAPEVEHALEKGDPVIALESTIITHGMPHPVNLTTAQSLETILRDSSVTPATIALIDGRVHVGLSTSQLEQLADPNYTGPGKVKASRRDLAGTLSKRLIGGTTVASTMYVAQSVGVDVFVTGGIGGAHRGSHDSMDISADLIELGRTPMAVVCAGAKSILDIPRTLEVLETQGVCVASYGDSYDFPAFYSPSSGQKSPWNVANPTEAASLIHAGITLPHPLATLLAVPIPNEYAARGEKVQQAVEQAVRESIEQRIDKRGKEVTPWLLKRVGELTGGAALELNVKLIENNARVGAAVALELARIKRESSASESQSHASGSAYYSSSSPSSSPQSSSASFPSRGSAPSSSPRFPDPPKVLVFGSAAIDITSRTPHILAPRSTTPGEIDLTPGGVGRNIAEAAQRGLDAGDVRLVSPIGASRVPQGPPASSEVGAAGQRMDVEVDTVGRVIMAEMDSVGMRTDGLIIKTQQQGVSRLESASGGQAVRSSACTLMLGKDGDLEAGVADMGIVETVTEEEVRRAIEDDGKDLRMIVHDCNPTKEVIGAILTSAYQAGIPTFCDPTSTPKLARIIPALRSLLPADSIAPRPMTHISPNTLELDVLHDLLTSPLDSSPLVENNSQTAWEFINSLGLTGDYRARLESLIRSGSVRSSGQGRQGGISEGGIGWLSQEGIIQKATALLPFFGNLWIKSGARGVVRVGIAPSHLAGTSGSGSATSISNSDTTSTPASPAPTPTADLSHAPTWRRMVYPLAGVHTGTSLIIAHYPAPVIRPDELISTTGAGDSLVGGLVAGLTRGLGEEDMLSRALDRVGKSLRSRRAVA